MWVCQSKWGPNLKLRCFFLVVPLFTQKPKHTPKHPTKTHRATTFLAQRGPPGLHDFREWLSHLSHRIDSRNRSYTRGKKQVFCFWLERNCRSVSRNIFSRSWQLKLRETADAARSRAAQVESFTGEARLSQQPNPETCGSNKCTKTTPW